MLDVMAESILLGWEGLEDDAGAPIPYSPAKAAACLAESRDLRAIVEGYSERADLYRREAASDAGKP